MNRFNSIKSLLIFSILSTIVAPIPLHAVDNRTYIGINSSILIHEQDTLDDQLNLKTLHLRVGYSFFDYFAIESRFGSTIDDDHYDSTGKTTLSIDETISLFIRGEYPVNRLIYSGTMGYSWSELVLESSQTSDKNWESDYSFGMGVEYLTSERFAVGAEYTQYISKPDFEQTGIGITLRYIFY